MLYNYAPMGLKVNVLGASGYAGGELVRLLAGHPALTPGTLGAHGQAGATIGEVHPHLNVGMAATFSTLDEAAADAADVCFSCLPTGVLGPLLPSIAAPVVIDLSDEHRASDGWVYGLTEFARPELAGATAIANPGCYPTASLLGLIPFFKRGLVRGPVIIDALSGVSGAGKGLDDSLSFSALHGSATAYGSTTHRHVPEIERALSAFSTEAPVVSFTPHLVPMARGLLVTARAPLAGSIDDATAQNAFRDEYAQEGFIDVIDGWPSTKAVSGTNRAIVSARVDDRAGLLIVSVAIDNLGKGAAGQAIQNANVAMGLGENAGLESAGMWP
jgi:N-acetyl-gamma-glutamyl-phosphate reductase